MELKHLQDELAAAAAERNLGPQQNPKNLAMAVAADAGALLALFRWLSDEQSWRVGGEVGKRAAANALADLITHALRLADELGVDVEAGILERLPPPAEPAPAAAAPPPPAMVMAEPMPAKAAARQAPARVEPPAPPAAAIEPIPDAAAAPEPAAPKRERKAAPEETPNWLDGLLRPPPAPRARRAAAEREAPPPVPVVAPAPPPAPLQPAGDGQAGVVAFGVSMPETTGSVEALTEAAADALRAAPATPPERPRYAGLDPDATKALVRSLAKRIGAARSDDPLLRDLHDELETLRRTLYSPTPKPSWVADSLVTIRSMLDEAAQRSFGAEIRAEEHVAQVDRILAA
jgi:dCTP diphosphatase